MITKEYTIWCDFCTDDWEQRPFYPNKERFFKVMKKDLGWDKRGKKHICPDCIALEKDKDDKSTDPR